MFGREAIVEVENPSTRDLVRYNGLDVRFNIKNVPGNFVWEATISILNLPRNIVQYYSKQIGIKTSDTWFNRPRIRLSVRYRDEHKQPVCIFDGRVQQGSISPAPNVWLTLQCQSAPSGGDSFIYTVSLPKKGEGDTNSKYSIKEICEEIAGITGTTVVFYGTWSAADNDAKDVFSEKGTIKDLYLKCINKMSPTLGVFYPGQTGNIYIGPVDKDGIQELSNVVKLDGEKYARKFTEYNGVIGIPQPHVNTLVLKTLLRPDERAGTVAKVELEHFPVMNGEYWISELTHQGQLRQGEWTTTYTMVNLNSAPNNIKETS